MACSQIFVEFEVIAHSFADKPCVTTQHQSAYLSLTFGELFNRSFELGKLLGNKGLKDGEPIAILMPNQPEWPISFMAIQSLGAIAVPLDLKLNPVEMRQLILHSGSKAVLASEKAPAEIRQHLENIKEVQVFYVDRPGFLQGKITCLPDRQAASPSGVRNDSGQDISWKDKIAAMFYTSGTTEVPKAVMLTQGNLLSNVESLKELNIARQHDVFISLLPLHHTYPFMVTCLFPILLGAKISYPESLQSQDLLKCMRETKVTIFTGVPQLFSLLNRGIKEKMRKLFFVQRLFLAGLLRFAFVLRKYLRLNLCRLILPKLHAQFGGTLRFMVSGGARLDPGINLDFFKWGFTMLEGYGLTETSPVATFNPPRKPKIGSVGRPIFGVQIKIANQDKEGIGEILIKGPNVMAGYYKLIEQTQSVLHEGWFSTGDLGYTDKNGYLYITGRKDEIIVLSSGKKINPEEIEKFYSSNPYIKEIFVFSSEKDAMLEGTRQLKALIVPDNEAFRAHNFVNIEEKIRWELDTLSKKIDAYKRINGFTITTKSFPRTPLGKIMRHRVKLGLGGENIPAKEEQTAFTEEDQQILSLKIYQELLKHLSVRFKKNVRLDDHLELDLGLDSLNRIELLLELQEFIDVQVPEQAMEELFFASTIRELALKIMPYLPAELQHIRSEQFQWAKVLNETPHSKSLNYIRLQPLFLDKVASFLMFFFLVAIFRVFFFLKLINKANVPAKGPCIIYVNHTSYFDPLIIAASLPFKVGMQTYFVGFKQIFLNPLIRKLVRVFRLIPIDINYELADYLQMCAYLLKNNKIVVFFPEGQRAPEGKVIGFKKGIGILAKELNPPLESVYIDGAFRSWPRGSWHPRPAKIKVKFGKVFVFPEAISVEAKERSYESIAESLRQKLLNLQQ